MFYLIGILISLAAGYLLIRLWTGEGLNPVLHLLLGLALGLGIDATVTFYIHILLNQFNRFIPVGLVLSGTALSAWLIYKKKPAGKPKKNKKPLPVAEFKFTPAHAWGTAALILLSIPLILSGQHYPLGGWDAWSCWNLKAKFIFLSHENWKDMLAPGLWRSNTHYPLLWPLINVWFWDLGGKFDQAVPMLNSLVIALLTAGILLFGLLELTDMLLPSLSAAVLALALPFSVTLYMSQYSDSLVGLYLLSAFVCLLLAEKCKMPKLKIVSMVFLGLMSFAKNEGLVAAAIAALLILWQECPKKNGFPIKAFGNDTGKLIFWFVVAALPTVIFTLVFAPKNEAFTNGLISTDKPTNWARLMVIAVYPWFEFISGKWNGFWLLAAAGIALAGKKLYQSTLGLIGLSLVLYLGAVMAYYAVNTFFEIQWWLSTTLSRILFALVPTIILWIGCGLKEDTKAA